MKQMILTFLLVAALLLVALIAFNGDMFRGGFVADCELPIIGAVCPFHIWVTSRPGALAMNTLIGFGAILLACASVVTFLFWITRSPKEKE